MGTVPIKGSPLTEEEVSHCFEFAKSLGLDEGGLRSFMDMLHDADGDVIRSNCKGMFAWPSFHWFMKKNNFPPPERGISLYR